MRAVRLKVLVVAAIAAGFAACSGGGAGNGAGGGGHGGTASTGGRAGSGGTSAETTTASGGVTASGGATASGGIVSSGGSGTRTDVGTTGGAGASGGTTAAGGSVGTGGGTATGGTRASGGVTSQGGASASGGVTGTGGASVATGGTAGARPTGGAIGSGGATPTGGIASSGGTPTTSTSGATGGVKGTGGTTSTCGTTAATLKAAAACTGRLIGVALSTQHLSESAYTTAAKEFNYVTPENEMKWSQIEPTRNQFSWSGGDQIVSFATSNGMKVKGHALVWHNQLPAWASALSGATDVRAAMLAHIKAVVGHYRGKVQAWDVVNEAVSLDGTGYRDSPFYKYLGITFIDEAFAAAREADPDVKLYYNDYNCEGLSTKANKVFALVKDLKSRGVPLDGVGLQMHYGEPNAAVPVADFVANMQRIADLGLDVLISEMDVHVCAGLTPTQQQALYHDLIAACVAQPRCVAASLWGITDKYSWLNDEPDLGCSGTQKPLGLLWDDNFKKKPAYTGVLNALLGL